MAFTFNVNQSPATGSAVIFSLKETLKSVGWTVPNSSDGTTYNASGDQITTNTTGAGGMANTNAWFRVRAPGGTPIREFVFQRGSSNLSWRIKYSAEDGFVGGTPGASRVPSATDEVVLLGTGTDASPTTANLFSSDGGYKAHVAAGDDDDGYSFYFFTLTNSTGAATAGCLVLDVLETSTVHPDDSDPAIIYLHTTTTNFSQNGISGEGSLPDRVGGWLAKNTTYENYINIPGCTYYSGSAVVVPSGLTTNPHNSKDDIIPIMYARKASLGIIAGYKGFGRVIKWAATTRTNGDTLSTLGNNSRDRIIVGVCSLPWDGSTPVL